MSNDTPKRRRATPDQQPEQPEPHDLELQALANLFRTHIRPVLVALAIVIVALAVAHGIRTRRVNRLTAASKALAEARSAFELEDIANHYTRTPSAPLALLALGRLHYDQGNYSSAREAYDRFLDRYARHDLAPAATLGRLHASEGLNGPGGASESAASYRAFIDLYPDHFLTPQAILGLGRCLDAQGDPDAAIALYTQFINDHPDSGWIPFIEAQIETLGRKRKPLPVVAPVAPLLYMTDEDMRHEDLADQDAPVKETPVEEVTNEEVSNEDAQDEDVSVDEVTEKDVIDADDADDTVPVEDAPVEDAPGEDVMDQGAMNDDADATEPEADVETDL